MQAKPLFIRALPLLLLFGCLAGCREGLTGCGNRSAATEPVNEAAIASHLRSIQSAQNAYMASHEHYACTMGELGNQFGLIDRQLSYGQMDGFTFTIDCSAKDGYPSYQAWATPTDGSLLGPNSYCIDQTGQLNHATRRLDNCSEGRPID
jgi:hypothetical protein